jgi:hypothetical protein
MLSSGLNEREILLHKLRPTTENTEHETKQMQ